MFGRSLWPVGCGLLNGSVKGIVRVILFHDLLAVGLVRRNGICRALPRNTILFMAGGDVLFESRVGVGGDIVVASTGVVCLPADLRSRVV